MKVVQSLQVSSSKGQAAVLPKGVGGSSVAKPDTFSLLLTYKDPFLAGLERNTHKVKAGAHLGSLVSPAVQAVAQPALPIAAPPAWPPVEYKGLIENLEKNSRVALVNIGGANQLLDEGKSADGVKLLSLYADSILVEYKKERKFVRRY